jgi:SAM-dependent methyltransferase
MAATTTPPRLRRLARRLLPPLIADRLLPPDRSLVEARRALWRSTPQTALEARHVAGCEVLPDRRALLARLPQGSVGAEAGVANGDFSAMILEIVRPRRLHLIDLWGEARFAPGAERVAARFAAEIAAGTVEMRRGYSTERLAEFEDGALDWVYIDTDHTYATTLEELRIARRKVRPGGLILGHDYATGNPVAPAVYGVIPACHRFCAEEGWRYRYLALEGTGWFSFGLERMAEGG